MNKVRAYFSDLREGKIPKSDRKQIFSEIRSEFKKFTQLVYQTRKGYRHPTLNIDIPGQEISFTQALRNHFGCNQKDILEAFGLNENMSLQKISVVLTGVSSFELTRDRMGELLRAHTEFSGTQTLGDYNPEFRFLLPELILEPIRLMANTAGKHVNWTAYTQDLQGNDEVTMPYLQIGGAFPKRTEENGDFVLDYMEFTQKKAKTYKRGLAFNITDELNMKSPLINVQSQMERIGIKMALGLDAEAIDAIINGEQSDGSESSAVIGVETSGTVAARDIKRITFRMRDLGYNPSVIIATEDIGLDLHDLPEFRGESAETKQSELISRLGLNERYRLDEYPIDGDQVLIMDPSRTIVKLDTFALKVEQQRNIQKQRNEYVVSSKSSFSVQNRDARFLLDRTLDYSTNGFPEWADINVIREESFGY